MKKKKTKDIFDTQCWQWQIITDPYQVVAEFFVLCDIANFRREITKIMRYTQRAKIPKDPDPTTLLLDMNALKSLIKAAYVLKNNKSISLKIDDKHLLNKNIYCHSIDEFSAWDDFPRFLSKAEFCNPYSVLKKFFKYQKMEKWESDLREIMDYALSKYIAEFEVTQLEVYLHLMKLMEATHLINVREVIHIDGRLKHRLIDK